VVERDILMSSLGIRQDQCFIVWSSLGRTLPHTSI